ncbi:MAG TPA: AzlC family ABC transporter permease [Candidatus Avacidaminococcus intestinavium]|uniref:AzlC family ABC transporter permease n=1 Tax=Candidatus Avacidaminococcus intestinavium TaxID=2840684 RepID=A0A9D1MP96_9FIRM|nr:AzlC family ABC transporter permease [Candidatus Avacidaminococcus intestinavium]
MILKFLEVNVSLSKSSRQHFTQGCQAALPIAIGYLPIAITFGILAKAVGIDPALICLMSLVIYAGASQFIAINLLALGTGSSEIILTTFILNLRHFLMSATLSQKLDKTVTSPWRALLAFGITDETFSVASFQKELSLDKAFLLGLNTLSYLAWSSGTALGVFFGAIIPDILQNSMGIALYAMFIGLLIPQMKKYRPALIVALLAMGLNTLYTILPFSAGLSSGWGIIISTIASAALGAMFYAKESNQWT